MIRFMKDRKKQRAIRKALLEVANAEKRLTAAAVKPKPVDWKGALEAKIPPKVQTGLEQAFYKGFSMVFHHGTAVIEKTYRKEAIQEEYNASIGGPKAFKHTRKAVQHSQRRDMAVTALEGISLGALGVGMPDIVLFLGAVFKGIYETALRYGFDYTSRQEQLLILKMMEASLSSGAGWMQKNAEVDEMLITQAGEITDDDLTQQLQAAAAVFAMDMLFLKFIQGIPLVGVVGGAANPVYHKKILKYVELKYRKRYLLNQMDTI